MKVESYEKKDGILQVMLCAEAEEFREARRRAYLEHTDRYPVPGCAGGLASLTDLENVYGPAVLYDEALELAVPELFGNLLKEKKIRIMGKPRMEHLTFTPEGGARFRVSSLRNVVASGSIILTVAFNSGNTGKSLCSFWKLIN